jgi:acyl-coenzyme A synthetase/AMP-(fatty) acid ligase
MDTIFETLEQYSEKQEDAPAIIDNDLTISRGEMLSRVSSIALGLTRLGLRIGGSVGLLMDKTYHLPLTFLGIIRARCAVVPIDGMCPKKTIFKIIKISKLSILVFSPQYKKIISEIAKDHPEITFVCTDSEVEIKDRVITSWKELDRTNASGAKFPEAKNDAIVYHHYCQDINGELDCYQFNMRHLILSCNSARQFLKLRELDKHFSLSSNGYNLHHQFLRPVITGGTIVISNTINVREISEIVSANKVNIVHAPPYFWRLISYWKLAGGKGFSSTRVMECYSEMPWNTRQKVANAFSGRVIETISLPYSCGVTFFSSSHAPGEGVLNNRKTPGVICRVNDDKRLDPEGGGELFVKGNMFTYKKLTTNGEEILQTDNEGWLHTGIAMRHTMGGDSEHLGTLDKFVEIESGIIPLRFTEKAVEHHEAVVEAVAEIEEKKEDKELENQTGITLVVKVENTEAIGVDELFNHLEKRIAPELMPDRIEITNRLPRFYTGEVDRRLLKKFIKEG